MTTLLNGTLSIMVGICMDADGHMHAVPTQNRIGLMKAIKLIADGDHYINTHRDWPVQDEDVEKMDELRWLNYLQSFVQRGYFTINSMYVKLV